MMTDDHRHGVRSLPGFKASLTVVLTALTISLYPVTRLPPLQQVR
jgi:hypothetical protein